MPRYLKNYDKETKDLINSIKLTPLQKSVVEDCLKNKLSWYGNVRLQDVFEDMYKLYVVGTSTEYIANVYSRSVRTIQSIFKNLGIERNKEVLLHTKIHSLLCMYRVPKETQGDLEKELLKLYK
jgi:hypothetical protein